MTESEHAEHAERETRSREVALVWAAAAVLLLAWVLLRSVEWWGDWASSSSRLENAGQEPPVAAGARLRSRGGATGLLFGRPLDLNRASAESLEVLPGVGPARAADIVAERERRPFERVEDLQRIHGIGPATVAGLAGWVSVSRATRGPDG